MKSQLTYQEAVALVQRLGYCLRSRFSDLSIINGHRRPTFELLHLIMQSPPDSLRHPELLFNLRDPPIPLIFSFLHSLLCSVFRLASFLLAYLKFGFHRRCEQCCALDFSLEKS